MTVVPFNGPAARAMRPVRLRSSRKFCPSGLRAIEIMFADDIAEWWKPVMRRRHVAGAGARSLSAIRAARRSDAIRLAGLAPPVPAISKAVP